MDGYEILHMTLKRIEDFKGYVLIVSRGDGKVLVLGTDNAPNRLIAINSACSLEHYVCAYRTDHFRAIVEKLKRRYAQFSEEGLGVWFHVDARELRAAVEEFDLESGERVRMGVFEVGGRAWVKGAGGGTITKLDERGAIVRLDRQLGGMVQAIAPRSLLKPYLRAVA